MKDYASLVCVRCKEKGGLTEQPGNEHWLECAHCFKIQPNPLNNAAFFPHGTLSVWVT